MRRTVLTLVVFTFMLLDVRHFVSPSSGDEGKEQAKPRVVLPDWLAGQWRGETTLLGANTTYECVMGTTAGGIVLGSVKQLIANGDKVGLYGFVTMTLSAEAVGLEYSWYGEQPVRLVMTKHDPVTKRIEFAESKNWWPSSVAYSLEPDGKLRWKAVGKGARGEDRIVDVLMAPIKK